MTTLAPATTTAPSIAQVQQEVDQARVKGPLREIVVPPCPELLVRLQRAMATAEPDLTEVGRIASADVAMAATLMRNANGALHAVGPPVNSVGQAMNRLGVRQTAAILTGFLARHSIPVHHPLLQRFWERSTRRAAAMEFIAAQLPGLSPDLAHSFGLFCHVGMPVMLQCVRGYGSTLVEAEARTDRSPMATENANHRTDHAVVGALVCRTWRFSPTLVAAVRLHHELDTLGERSAEPEAFTLVAAGLIAEQLMRRAECMPADRDWREHADAVLRWLAVEASDLDAWAQALQPVFDTL